MRRRTSSIQIELTCEQRDVMMSWLRCQKTPVGLAKRARAMLRSNELRHALDSPVFGISMGVVE